MDKMYERVLLDAMIHHGFSPAGAKTYLGAAESAVLADSDHTAYRELADEIRDVFGSVSDLDAWDQDWEGSELGMLKIFVAWLPDIVRHQEAENIRDAWIRSGVPRHWSTARALADALDPFELDGDGWRRKSTGEQVPPAMLGTK